MKVNDRDGQILQHIVIYCDEVNNTIKRFGNDKRSFETDYIYRNAVSMPILQIGELAKSQNTHPQYRTRQIKEHEYALFILP